VTALKPVAKALTGAAIAGLAIAATALTDEVITPAEWVGIAGGTLAALYGVWRVPNTPADS
jgi:hypothetical protein